MDTETGTGPVEELRGALEAVLLVVDSPIDEPTLAEVLEAEPGDVQQALDEWAAELERRGSGIELRKAGGGWRLYTRPRYAGYVEKLVLDGSRARLTRAALETLAVVAYRQPVTRARVSAVRGVNVDGVMRTLVARGLVTEAGHEPESGANLYVTTELFLERLGLPSLSALPDLEPLLPDLEGIDELSRGLDDEPRFIKHERSAGPTADTIDIDTDQTP